MVKKIQNSVSVLHFTDKKHGVLVESLLYSVIRDLSHMVPKQSFLCNEYEFM